MFFEHDGPGRGVAARLATTALSANGISITLPTIDLVAKQDPPAAANTVIAFPYSGDNRIDALLGGAANRFNANSPPGTPVTVTYSFLQTKPDSYTGDDANQWQPFTEEQKAATRTILNQLSQEINVTFQEVSDASGYIRFSDNKQVDSAGYALYPNATGTDKDSDVWIALGYTSDQTPGSYSWKTLVHELGHALGLQHPGNYNAGENADPAAVGNFLGVNEDAFFNSIMSYRGSAQGINETWFMPYDMLALRYMYGTKAYHTGDDVYKFTDASGQQVQDIVDDGGTDTLDFSALSIAVRADMRPGAYSHVGLTASGDPALANVSIAFDATIENAVGTKFNDTIIGNAANNVITGGAGNDTIDGGAGVDTSVYAGAKANYTITKTASGFTVADNQGGDGTDMLANIERLRFSDETLAYDLGVSDPAGEAILMMAATLGPVFPRDKGWAGKFVGFFNSGATLADGANLLVAVGIMSALAGGTDNKSFVNFVYNNVYGSLPDAATLASLVAPLDAHTTTQAAWMAQMAASQQNQTHVNLAGFVQSGFEYV
jgi:hypothetical protein